MLPVPEDPLQEVRVFKGRLYLFIFLVLLTLVPFASFVLRLSILEASLLFILGLALGILVGEYAARYGARLRKRIALPSVIGVRLASIHDLSEACQVAVELVGRWLGAKATVIAWLDDIGQELTPAAAFGRPADWLETAPRLAMGQHSLRKAVQQSQVIVKPSTKADPWFGDFKDQGPVIYVPLISHQHVVGVLALVGDGQVAELDDRKLLSDLGAVLACALDNCRLYEAERQRAQQMQALARLKSDFLITVSHELRTPLTSIRTAAEMLLEEETRQDPSSPRTRLARHIVKGASRLTSLVADLVDMSRQGDPTPRLEMERIPVAEVVSNALAQVYPLLHAKGQAVELHIPSPSPDILVDRRRFEQVIVNLLSNAHRYTPSEGHLAVRVEEKGGEVAISVSDSGPGIPEKERESIFEPFYRGERGGMGLGLAIAKALVELHGGRIWVDSSESGGSTFHVALPKPQEGPPLQAAAAKTA